MDVEPRGRVNFPARLVASIAWLATGSGGVDALMVLEEPGRISLRSWKPFGEAVLARRQELIREAEEGDAAAQDDLLLLEDRYNRVTVPKERRLTLITQWLLHLGLEEGVRNRVYVARVFDQLVIMSKEYRDRRLRRGSVALSDLP